MEERGEEANENLRLISEKGEGRLRKGKGTGTGAVEGRAASNAHGERANEQTSDLP